LLVLNIPDEGGVRRCDLVRYRFRDDELVGKDLILSSNEPYFFGVSGGNRIHANRFVITRWGSVVDIEQKIVLHKGEGNFLGIEGDGVFIRANRVDQQGYFYYDLRTRKYMPLEKPGKWALQGSKAQSPDGKTIAVVESGSNGGTSIRLHRLDGRRELLGSGFAFEESETSDGAPPTSLPLLWLDNDRILTQKSNGKLVVVRMDKSKESLVDIPIDEKPVSPPSLFWDAEKKVIYTCGRKAFIIDVKDRRFRTYEWMALGHGFDGEYNQNPRYGRILRHNGKEIGRWWCQVWRAPTAEGYLAVPYGPVGSIYGEPRGVKVWGGKEGKWTTINGWVEEPVGWIAK
jgi:hypothetical protein